MKLRNLTERFLENLAEAVDSLSVGSTPSSLNPTIAVLSALVLTGTAAFSYGFALPALILAISVVLVLLAHSSVRQWTKILLFVSVWVALVSAPLPFITPGKSIAVLSLGLIELGVSFEGLNEMIAFISRTTAAAAIFTSFASAMGWRRIVNGLEGLRMPGQFGLFLNLSIIHIPLFLRETAKMLSARESRIVRKIRIREVWRVLSTVVGDLLLRGYERSWRLEKAINARSFIPLEPSLKTPSTAMGIKDFLLLFISLCILTLGVLSVV
ncbi:MAG: hypothetical protein JSV85_01085 [Candidatus Bathyarchaeota archaeon]|nr:MAG: hypothetical protein JSV85_01085 [Candidatus Bathyarchaeota archaeon]